VGLCAGLVCCRYHHDSHGISFPFQHGVVGLHIPRRYVQVILLRYFSVLTVVIGVFTLLTISIGEEFDFRFFKILSCVSGIPEP
jgi:hypothetical protein